MNKRQECAQVYQQTCEQATHTKEDWYSLLESISRLYKYSFSEQAFIHAQNPHATACATSKIWNDAMHRYIKGGSKGIAVIDYSQTEPKINYVFDVNDTQEAWHKNAHPKLPNHWQITDEPSIVAEWKKAGLNSNTLSEQINERLMQSLHFCKDDADYQAIFASVSYVVHKRCGLSSNIANHDFQSIQEQDVSKIGHIGFMVSRQSQIILREIESIAKQQERKKERGDSLQTRGGLSSSRLRDGQPTQATIEQVRHGTQSLPRERTSEPVQSSMYDDGIVSPLLRSGDASQRTARNLNEPTPKERPTTRQSDTAHRVDSSHEQSQSTSGRNHLQGTDLQPIDPIDIGEKESETLSFDNISDEPYVVIEWSESPYFEENELLRFTQADAKFKTVERHERNRQIKEQGELGGYDKTSGIIHCKTTDGKSLTYKFRYDIGDYDENQSGLYNHIHSFWDYQDKHPSFVSIQEDTEFGLRFAKALQPYQSEFDYSMPIVEPTKYSESKNEPYVVIHSSESPYFNEDEILIFHEADEKFKLAEPHESHNESADDYQNVRGAIHYTSNHTISTYEFSYDIGTYRENQAGLYNHIRNSKEVETRLQLLSALESYQSDFDYSTQPIEPDRTQQQESESKQPTNYRITDDFTSESAKRTCAQNMEAITLLTQIEKEERFATPHEQEVLALYVGWGGIPQAFDADNRFWKQEYESLKTLLSPEEYEQARASTLNAHYTSPVVINAMYQAVEQMGFSGGKVLEPALGTGNFFGSMPQDMAQNSQLQGVELDPLTARIAKQLYPTAQIHNTGFEKTNFPDDSFDLVISNVPFGSYAVMDMQNRSLNALNANIHDYFIGATRSYVKSLGANLKGR